MNTTKRFLSTDRTKAFVGLNIVFAFVALASLYIHAQDLDRKPQNMSDLPILNQYVESMGKNTICFDKSNVKQFWIDNSVVSRNESIEICLNDNNESVPLIVKLANVNETLDCDITVISDSSNIGFEVMNDGMKTIASSQEKEKLIQYSISAATFHLEETLNYAFFLKFNSKSDKTISIKKIVLSFSKNNKSSFLSSPGTLHLTPNSIQDINRSLREKGNSNSFTASGTSFTLFSLNKIYVTNNHIQTSATIKNIGNNPTRIYLGYAPYTEGHQRINRTSNPYKSGKILNIVESTENSNKVVVDAYPEWEKGCFLALNAKEDLSDFPNTSIIESRIIDVKEKDSSHTEIYFEHPLKREIKKGTSTRVQCPIGDTYIYKTIQILQPGEEVTLSASINKDNNLLAYSASALCRGTYYVVPLILSISTDSKAENTILIKDFTISY